MTLIDFAATTNFFPGFKSHWGVEGYVFSSQTKDHDHDRDAADIDGSAWGNRFENMLTGQSKASNKVNGLASGAPGQVSNVIKPWVGKTIALKQWHAHETLNLLSPITFGPVSFKKYSESGKFKEAVTFNTELNYRGDVDDGFILVTPKTTNVLTTTGNGSDLDNGAALGATTFGANAQLHMYDLAGGTTPSVTVVIQHSPDGTTWTTLGSFVACTNLTAATTFVQRITIGSTVTVNQHVRAQWTTSGTPTGVQAMVLFARNVDPDS